ncbi:MAG: hypothetical protein KI790_11745 [Cyclobacteriaceae bacterium]|nr:hypothetical protein [Cyclobacteriaceae bacterium HetDA_MAG_MS6]
MKSLVSALLLLVGIESLAQSPLFKKMNFDFDLGFGTYYQFTTLGSTAFNSAVIPDLLPRRINDPMVRANWNLDSDLVTDNPFFHGSYFFRLGGQFVYDSTLHVTMAANMEQRGFSDGRFSSNTFNTYSYFNAWYLKKRGKLSYLLQVGDFWDMRLYEGLTFYNLQTQSAIFKLKYGPFYFKYAVIGDLLIGIGLGIDDVYDYSFGLEKLKLLSESMHLDMRMGYSHNRRSASGGFWNLSTRFTYKDQVEIYSQYSTHETGGALLVGLDLTKKEISRFTYNVSVDFRNYSSGFNSGYINNVYYRNPGAGSSFTNSTARAFVPLEFYERPFGQWAVFTEYQGRNVRGFSLKGALSYNLFRKTFVQTKLDLNWINTKEESVLYPFYSIGLGDKPAKDIEIMLELTNRVLNLDKHYPTLYASKTPYFMIRAYKRLRYLQDNDRQHRR